jgi:hypothetical protein
MKKTPSLLAAVLAISGFLVMVTPTQAGGKKHWHGGKNHGYGYYRGGGWNGHGYYRGGGWNGYGYRGGGWNGYGYGCYQPYYRPVYYYSAPCYPPVYYAPAPAFGFWFGFR